MAEEDESGGTDDQAGAADPAPGEFADAVPDEPTVAIDAVGAMDADEPTELLESVHPTDAVAGGSPDEAEPVSEQTGAAPDAAARRNRLIAIGGAIAAVILLITLIVVFTGGDSGSTKGGTDATDITDGSDGPSSTSVADAAVSAAGERFDFSPDGTRIAVAGWGQPTTVWDVASGSLLLTIDEPAKYVEFSADGSTLLTYRATGADRNDPTFGPVHTWNAGTGARLAEIPDPEDHTDPAFLPDGRVLTATASGVDIWNGTTGAKVHSITTGQTFSGFSASPDGSTVVVLTNGTDVHVYDTGSGQLRYDLPSGCRAAHPDFSSNGRLFSVFDVCTQSTVIMETASGREVQQIPAEGRVESTRFSIDGAMLITCQQAADNPVLCRMWEIESGLAFAVLEAPADLPDSYRTTDTYVNAAISPDGISLAMDFQPGCCIDPGWTAVYSLFTMQPTLIAGNLANPRFSPDNQQLAGVYHDPANYEHAEVRVFAVDELPAAADEDPSTTTTTELVVAPPAPSFGLVTAAQGVAHSPDGTTLAFFGANTPIVLYSIPAKSTLLTKIDERAAYAEFNPQGSMLLTVQRTVDSSGSFEDGPVHTWRLDNGQRLGEFLADGFNRVGFSPDGRSVVGITSGVVQMWDATTGAEIRSFPAFNGRPTTRWTMSPDGTKIALETGPSIEILDVATGASLRTLTDITGCDLGGAMFTNDSARLAGWAACGARPPTWVRMWDVASGAAVLGIEEPAVRTDAHRITPAVRPDGGLVITEAGDFNTLQIWDGISGYPLSTLTHKYPYAALDGEFSPDGHHLLVHLAIGFVVWNLDTGREELHVEAYAVVHFLPDSTSVLGMFSDPTVCSGNEMCAARIYRL